MSSIAISMAFLIDLVLGDPPGWPHPVKWIGRLISFLEAKARRMAEGEAALKAAGVVMVVTVAASAWAAVAVPLYLLNVFAPAAAWIASVLIAYTTIATRSLYAETWRVVRALTAGDIERARKLLSMVVGRETKDLGRPEILRAVIETIAENLSDGVIAPLFYLALGGPALGMAFKAVSTMDSMIGYKNEKYRHLGWAAARTDDIVNFIPARITAALIVAAAFVLRLNSGEALRTWLRDGGNHTSPNAGRPEAAMAGALMIQLGGTNIYHGKIVEKPVMGRAWVPVDEYRADKAEQILVVSSGFMILIIAVARSVI